MVVLDTIKANFFSGHERSVRAKKNIIFIFMVRGYNIAISFALIPLTLKLLDDYEYGVWITLFNVLSWISIFDIGIGNGLRNKFAEAMAKGNILEAKEYVSTGYITMFGIAISLILIFFVPWLYLDWAKVFNVKSSLSSEISQLMGITFVLMAVQFCIKLIGTILTASHKPYINGLIMGVSNTLILAFFFFGQKLINGNLVLVGVIYTLSPIIVYLVASIVLFAGKLSKIKPSLSSFRKEKMKDLFSLGIQFFVIQIAVLIIFQTDSLIISHTLNPAEVTPYNIVFKYFGIATMVFGIIMTPYWSAYTEASAKNDYKWIVMTIKTQLKLLIPLIFGLVILLYLAQYLIPIWIGKTIEIPLSLLIGMMIYAFISIWNNIFSFLLNGLSKTKTQIITSIIGLLINIPISIFFAKYIGSSGVIFGTIISLLIFAIFGSYEAFLVLKKEVNGK